MSPNVLIIGIGITIWSLALGSFATALVYRGPRGYKWYALKGNEARSCCPYCGTVLSWRDLIPLFSWLMYYGKCRHCNTYIGLRYIIIEIACVLLCFAIVYGYGISLCAFLAMSTIPFMFAVSNLEQTEKRDIRMKLQVYPALFGMLCSYEGFLTGDLNGLLDPAIHLQQFVKTTISIISYMALCLLCIGLSHGYQLQKSTVLTMLFLGMVSGLWLEYYMLPAFFGFYALSLLILRIIDCAGLQVFENRANTVWPVSVASFYLTLLSQGIL